MLYPCYNHSNMAAPRIIIDTYGGWGAHGGGAFSGKNPTKVPTAPKGVRHEEFQWVATNCGTWNILEL